MGRLCAKLFSNKSWHCLHWKSLQRTRQLYHVVFAPRKNAPPLGITCPIMPRDRALLDLDMTPRRPLRIIPENLRHLVHPTHVQLCRKVDPSVFVVFRGCGAAVAVAVGRLADEAAVFGAHTEVFDVSEVEFQKGLVATRDDVDNVARIRGEFRQGIERIQ